MRANDPSAVHVVHFTSGHLPNDIRVFQKECRTLAQAGYRVTLVARHPHNDVIDGVQITAVPNLKKDRRTRLSKTVWKVYRAAARQQGDVYHFHDPELLPAGLLLKVRGRKVIYDAHEAFARKLMSKPWIPRLLRPLAAHAYGWFERMVCRLFDHVVAADRTTASAFAGSRVTVVANYPLITEAQRGLVVRKARRERHVLVYAGDLVWDRGIRVMLDIADLLRERVELRLLGRWADAADERRASKMSNVRFLGFQPLQIVYEQLMNADLGLVLLQPVPAYLYAGENTNKIFEYMSCALPVVASNFPGFMSVVNRAQCGICMDPTNAQQAARDILRLLEQPELREQMGRNGRGAVLAEYNWDMERQKLLAVYEEIAGAALRAKARQQAAAPLAEGRHVSSRAS